MKVKSQNEVAQLCLTLSLLSAAFAAAKGLIAEDRTLASYPELLSAINSMFEVDASALN